MQKSRKGVITFHFKVFSFRTSRSQWNGLIGMKKFWSLRGKHPKCSNFWIFDRNLLIFPANFRWHLTHKWWNESLNFQKFTTPSISQQLFFKLNSQDSICSSWLQILNVSHPLEAAKKGDLSYFFTHLAIPMLYCFIRTFGVQKRAWNSSKKRATSLVFT